MIKSKSLSTTLLVTMISLCLVLGSFMVFLLSNEKLKDAKIQVEQIRTSYVDAQKEMLQIQVKQAVDYIRHKKSLTEKRTKEKVKARTYEAYETALYIYNKNKKSKSLSQIKKLVHDALYAAVWDNGRGYYFAEDMTGIERINRNNPELEGKNILQIQDSKGTYIVKNIIEIAQSVAKEGFCSYYWNKPDSQGQLVPKISFVKYFEPFDWVIGNGKYLVDEEKIIQQEVIERIEQIKYAQNGYLFAGTFDGLSLSGPFKGKNMIEITDSNGVRIVQRLIEAAKSGGEFVEYVAPKFKGMPPAAKISYAQAIPEWKWYIGTGLHIDSIEAVVSQKQEELKKDIKLLIIKYLAILCFFTLLYFVLALFISQKIKKTLNIFKQFFVDSAKTALPISDEKVFFSEFKDLASSVNIMSEQRKESEQALQKSERKYRLLFNSAPAGMYEIDFLNNRFLNVNDAMTKITGYSKEELLKIHSTDIVTKESIPLLMKNRKDILAGRELPEIVEIEAVRKNGEHIFVHVTSYFVYDQKHLQKAMVVVQDITQQKRAIEEKLRAQKLVGEQKKMALVGQIAGKMAHDFNNILSIIMGTVELLIMDSVDSDSKAKLEIVLKQTLCGKNLTKNLVAFAKDSEPKHEFFKLNEKIDLVVNLLEKDLTGIELVESHGSDMPDLLADPGMIEHALVNMIQNSVHATTREDNPKIEIRTHCDDNNIVIEIKDNGCGIPAKHLDDIFEPSFTLKGSRDFSGSYEKGIKGTGYGMSNVKKYIELHKGRILTESEQGAGTTFTIELPVVSKDLKDRKGQESEIKEIKSEKSILIVEDEITISTIQKRLLTQEPFCHKVDIVTNGPDALSQVNSNQYDLISLDYMLSGRMNGMDVYEALREAQNQVPVIFISGNIEFLESIKELKKKDTFVDHLSKPYRNQAYVNAVNSWL